MMHNAIARLILWGRKSGVSLDPVELSGGVTAARLEADPDDPAIQRRGACIRAASDLFFAARRPDVYADALPGYRAACVSLGLDPDACAAVGVDAVPVC